MPTVTYSSAVSELYTVPREAFVARRAELAKAARSAGDRDLATRIGKLAKPTTAAWLANELARTDPDDVRALADLGAALRAAHERLDGAEIRSLVQRRAELIGELMGQAGDRGDEPLGEAVSRDLTDILTAATADEAVARALVAGTLSSSKVFASPPEWPPPGAGPKLVRPTSNAEQTSKVQGKTTTGSMTTVRDTKSNRSDRQRAELREQAQRTLKAARAEVKRAEADRAASERSLAEAEAAAEAAATEVERLEAALRTAEREEVKARAAVTSARRSAREATDRAARSWRQVQAAEAKLSG